MKKMPPKLNRIYHTWDKWECYPAGFYETGVEGVDDSQGKESYRAFLADIPRFRAALERVTSEWQNSCEHYLTNDKMNRIAWLGQAAACIDMGLPSRFRSGYFLLTDDQKRKADLSALDYLNDWLHWRGHGPITLQDAGVNAEVNLY